MEKTKADIILTIIFATIVIIILSVFALLFFLTSIRKKQLLLQEQNSLKQSFEKTLLNTQIEIQEYTLEKLSEEIHDNIGQILSLVSLNLNTLICDDKEKLNSTIQLVDQVITDLRNLSKGLHSEKIKQIGLMDLIKSDLERLNNSGKYQTSYVNVTDFYLIDPEIGIIIYRMIQEILNNILKHAFANHIEVEVYETSADLFISVTDNGIGFIPENSKNGLGLINLKNRAKLIKSTFTINSKQGSGTAAVLQLSKNAISKPLQ